MALIIYRAKEDVIAEALSHADRSTEAPPPPIRSHPAPQPPLTHALVPECTTHARRVLSPLVGPFVYHFSDA